MKSYGITNRKKSNDKIEHHLENLNIKGFSVEEGVLNAELCDDFANRLEKVYKQQETDFGVENLEKIQELDMTRMPFFYDKKFFDLFLNPLVLELAEQVLGKIFTLHLQNGIINRPEKVHHQTSWHRDLPYQDWVISKPLGFNAFYCISDFTRTNGATFVLPHSHKIDYFPSDKFVKENETQVIVPKGSIFFFDSMIYHRAGVNASDMVRYGINHLFVVPILKQQINIAKRFEGDNLEPKVAQLLGIPYQIPDNVEDFRNNRIKKL